MGSIKGDISVMPLSGLLQWVELTGKTGTIFLRNQDVERKVYVEAGKIIFVSSTREGERLGEYLHRSRHLELEKIRSALLQSQNMKVPFTRRLIELRYFTTGELKEIITDHAKEILNDSLRWPEGGFEFIQDELPSYVLRGTISLTSSELIYTISREIEAVSLSSQRKNK